ncbi:hypothetical protein BDZ89DRAFT_678424 [Hymenopellis radicata]|nr:hypothetical protein BDZ89DRAFT_678424 [Hymenopellis radicata]
MFARRWRASYLSSRRLLTTTTKAPPPPESMTGAPQVDASPALLEQVPYLMPGQGPRLLRVYDLPAGYNLSEVIKAAGGLIVNVTPGENHVILEYYSWLQTVSHRKTITLHGEEYPLERTYDRYGLNTSVVARLGREQLSRQLNIVFSSEQAPLTTEDLKSRVSAFGPLEDFQSTMSPDV